MISSMQLAYYGPNGERVMDLNNPPTTEDIAKCALRSDEFVVQLIGGWFTVYDLRTLKPRAFEGTTIGLPVAESRDFDHAVMTALLSQ